MDTATPHPAAVPTTATPEDLIVRERLVINARTAFQEIREQAAGPHPHPMALEIVAAGEESYIDAALQNYDWAVSHPVPLVDRNWLAKHTIGAERFVFYMY